MRPAHGLIPPVIGEKLPYRTCPKPRSTEAAWWGQRRILPHGCAQAEGGSGAPAVLRDAHIGNTVIETDSLSKKTDTLKDFDKQLIAGMEEVVAHIKGESNKGRATVC